jgi:hypothetical protein
MPKTRSKHSTKRSKTRKMSKKITKSASTTKSTQNSDYIVAIPTYKRYQQVYEKSIKTLLNGKVPFSKIYIFVANKEEEKEYRNALPKDAYHKIVVGVIGINNQRKFMNAYFKEGTNVLYLDDDVEKIEKLMKDDTFSLVPNLDTFIKNAFKECRKKGIYLWGIYPVRNNMFMKARPVKTYGLRFILGTFYGQIIRHSEDLITTMQEKEDFENSILHYKKDCGVLRFEHITLKTKFYNPEGGIAAMTNDRKAVHKKAAAELEKKYGDYGTKWVRQNGIHEFRLKSLPYKC